METICGKDRLYVCSGIFRRVINGDSIDVRSSVVILGNFPKKYIYIFGTISENC